MARRRARRSWPNTGTRRCSLRRDRARSSSWGQRRIQTGLYQADWLLRFYGFHASELLDEAHPDFDTRLDPKCSWALAHLEQFPVEVMRADLETLLRVPGVGPVSARRIVSARRCGTLRFEDLKKLGVVVKRAQYFLTCGGRMPEGLRVSPATRPQQLALAEPGLPGEQPEQLSRCDQAGVAV